MTVSNAARAALLVVNESPYPREIGGIEWRLALLWPRGTATVARGEPVSTPYRVLHRARYAVVGEPEVGRSLYAVRTFCGAVILDPRAPAEVALLTSPNSVVDCLRCLHRSTPRRRRPADVGLLVDPATGLVLDEPLPGLER